MTTDVMSHSSQTLLRSEMWPKSTGPCSPSMRMESNPNCLKKSTISGVSCPPVSMVATSPRSSFFFVLFSLNSAM